MIKRFIRSVVYGLVEFWARICSYSAVSRNRARSNMLYTLWVRPVFGSIGTGAYIAKPIYLQGGRNITIGNNFWSDRRVRIDTFEKCADQYFTPKIIIGNNVSINQDCHLGAINRIEIGDNVLIASKVYIADHSHGRVEACELDTAPNERLLWSKGAVVIQDNVWIGENVSILPGVTIGRGAIIGANAVVTRSIPAYAVAAGNPARVIKQVQ